MNKRKKWTPQEEITESVLKSREKRKWQLALRRYILESTPSQFYAPFFGLPIEDFRKWIELQFNEDINWANFGSAWQFDHIVPIAHFDFSVEEDLRLCWNFINIQVEYLNLNKTKQVNKDISAAKSYFLELYNKTGLQNCLKMAEKINLLQKPVIQIEPALEHFLLNRRDEIESLKSLTNEEFNSINQGISLKNILLEKSILKKFG
ncbi:MAG: hypothetical protein ABIT07_12345 [Ferruginibacter sp.]